MGNIIDRLITDRAPADVNRINSLREKWYTATITKEEMMEWFTDLKGAYNASDLNRVGEAMEYISMRLVKAGYGHAMNLKTDWQMSDAFTAENTKYYLESLYLLRKWFTTWETTPPTPDHIAGLTYQEANDIEKILIDIDELITKMQQNYIYSGELYAGEV